MADKKAEPKAAAGAMDVTLTGGLFPALSIPGLPYTKNLTRGHAVRCSAEEVAALKKGMDSLPVDEGDILIEPAAGQGQ